MGVDVGGWGGWSGLVKKQKKYLVKVLLHLSMKHNNKERNPKNYLNRNLNRKNKYYYSTYIVSTYILITSNRFTQRLVVVNIVLLVLFANCWGYVFLFLGITKENITESEKPSKLQSFFNTQNFFKFQNYGKIRNLIMNIKISKFSQNSFKFQINNFMLIPPDLTYSLVPIRRTVPISRHGSRL